MIIDAHHHLWDLSAVEYPWLRAKGVERFFGDPTPIQGNYDVAQFRADWCDLPVLGSVHIQVGAAPHRSLDETGWLEARAQETGLPSVIVAFADLSRDDAMRTVDQHMRVSDRLRGIRHIISRHPSEDKPSEGRALLDDPIFQQNLINIADRGLSFDLQLTPPHLHRAAELFGQVPSLRVALCHAGSPWSRNKDGLLQWRQGLEAMARLPWVTCKLSGLGMFDRSWTPATLRPIVETVLETFGSNRVMWGSNFPVDRLYHDYSRMVEAIGEIVPDTTHSDIFAATANRFYSMGLVGEAS